MTSKDWKRLGKNMIESELVEKIRETYLKMRMKAIDRANVLKDHFPNDNIPNEVWLSEAELHKFLTISNDYKKVIERG